MATPATTSPCDAGFLSQVFSGNAIVCSKTFQDYEASSEKSQIQSVADNAAEYYGDGSPTAQIAQATATQQIGEADMDVTNVTQAVSSSKVGQIFTTCDSGDSGLAVPGLPCISFKWLGVGVAALVALYFLAVVSSFVPRPR